MIKLSKRKKEIIGLILISFSIITTVSLVLYDVTENPFVILTNIKHPFGIWGIRLAYAHFFALGYISIIFPFIYFEISSDPIEQNLLVETIANSHDFSLKL